MWHPSNWNSQITYCPANPSFLAETVSVLLRKMGKSVQIVHKSKVNFYL